MYLNSLEIVQLDNWSFSVMCNLLLYYSVTVHASEWVERRLPMWKVWSLNPSKIRPLIYKIGTCCHVAWCGTQH